MLSSAQSLRAPASHTGHSVRFDEDDGFLAADVARYIAAGLRTGHAGLVIARPALLATIRHHLQADRLPRPNDRLQLLDAQQLLDSFLVEGRPDEALFAATIGAQMERGTADGRVVCTFCEMVALLREQGHQEAAARLEELWNGLSGLHSYSDHGLALARHQQQAVALEQALAERDRLQDELANASRAKDEFLAMLGHELRNPLSPIVTALELMKLRGDTATAREQALIRRQVDNLLRMVDDLMDVSRVTRGKIELRRQPCKVSEMLWQAAESVSLLIEQRRHELSIELEDPELRCEADAARLAQVVGHLLTNAARYTEPGGRIVVAARTHDGEVELSVSDNGAGIAPAMLEPIFETFRQGKRGIDRREGGLGLGLALVRSLVQLHGGRVWAESGGLGQGSRFVVRLPGLVKAAPAAETHGFVAQAAATVAANDPVQPTVLVVDDNREAADFLAELLAAYGCQARVAYDPAEALQLLDSFQPEVAILDIGLPVMDGYELAVRIREKLGGSSCRLFALSGYGLPADRARSAAAGFERHLVKPVDASRIAELINGD